MSESNTVEDLLGMVKRRLGRSRWQAVGCSVRGAAHLRADTPNQDRIGLDPESGTGDRVVIAVADGHGSARYLRSATGAALAVKAAQDCLRDFVVRLRRRRPTTATLAEEAQAIPRLIVDRWRSAVEQDLATSPFTDEEVQRLSALGEDVMESVRANPPLAYGATLLAVLATPRHVICWQLGDGDILGVSGNGTVERMVSRDPRLLGVETTSLCGRDAWNDFRVAAHAVTDKGPRLVLLSTDGYSNSFSDEASFFRVGTDLASIIRRDGLAAVRRQLPTWLEETSRDGSGDDISVGILRRTN